MSHLEDLIAEYYDWKGYLVKRNIKVGRLSHGGWEMELDIIGYHPQKQHLVHLEPSIDAHSWVTREARFEKKFRAGRKYIPTEIFTWLPPETSIDQIAVLVSHPKGRDELAGATLISVDEFVSRVRADVESCGVLSKGAIAEQYPLLRTIQLSTNGYYRVVRPDVS